LETATHEALGETITGHRHCRRCGVSAPNFSAANGCADSGGAPMPAPYLRAALETFRRLGAMP
jgi:hypothetical protein